jgi:hypothetical protein
MIHSGWPMCMITPCMEVLSRETLGRDRMREVRISPLDVNAAVECYVIRLV